MGACTKELKERELWWEIYMEAKFVWEIYVGDMYGRFVWEICMGEMCKTI